jgi:hypothetical protein
MTKLSTLILGAVSARESTFNGNRKVGNRLYKEVMERGIADSQDKAFYESLGSCALRSALKEKTGEDQCCDFRNEYDHCTGCLHEDVLGLKCHQQPIFAYEYILDEYGEETEEYEFVTSRDCFCDQRCMDYDDCCDDFQATCPQFFEVQDEEHEMTEITNWPSGKANSNVFIAGIGATQDEAIDLCAANQGRIISFDSFSDLQHFWEIMGFADKHQVRFHVPYKNIRMGGYATEYKTGYWNGKWIEADTKVEPASGMKTFWGKKSSTDGMGQCSIVQGSWLGYARMTDHMCHTRAIAYCEKVDAVIPYVNDFGDPEFVDGDLDDNEETTMEPTTVEQTTTTTVAPELVMSFDEFMTSTYEYVNPLGLDYVQLMFCSLKNDTDLATYFEGECPPKVMKIHNQIIKTHDSFFKKIEKDTKKVMNFSHNKCDKNLIFKKDIFDFNHVEGHDFSSIEDAWKAAVSSQLDNTDIAACAPQSNKLQQSIKKVLNWLKMVAKKIDAFETKQDVMFAKEVAKAIKAANKAGK